MTLSDKDVKLEIELCVKSCTYINNNFFIP